MFSSCIGPKTRNVHGSFQTPGRSAYGENVVSEQFLSSDVIVTRAESINSDLQRGLDKRLCDTHNIEDRTEPVNPLKYQRTINTTATLVVNY